MTFEIVAVCLAGLAIAAYFERKSLRNDVVAAEAKAAGVAERVVGYAEKREKVLREIIAGRVSYVIAAAKTEAAKLEADVKADVTKAEGAIQALITKLEADIKKVI